MKNKKFQIEYVENPEVATLKKLVELDDKFNLKKGDKGDKGEKGDKPIVGIDYQVENGIDGKTPIKNKDYFDGKHGKDGSPDTPKQIVDKLNTLTEKVEIKTIKGLERILKSKAEKNIIDKAIKETLKELKSPNSKNRLEIKDIKNAPKPVWRGGGATRFTGLMDTPDDYDGEKGKFVIVNPGEDGLEFTDGKEKLSHEDLDDMPDADGENTDHDVRYVAKVQDAEPTDDPTPYEGQFWYDTDADGGALPYIVNVKTKTADHTADDTDYVLLMDTTGGALTLTLPIAVGIAGRVYVIKNIGNVGNSVDVETDGTEEIDTTASKTLLSLTAIRIISDNANWWIL